MTDNEIIKAFKCCYIEDPRPNCKECPIEGTCANCNLDYEIFSLINRQKAEIEKLKQENEFCHKTITENAQRALEVTVEAIETAKFEAIKEFAERLKIKATVVHKSYSGIHYYETDDNEIGNLVKEMTEVEE